jgi:hypothetical protein
MRKILLSVILLFSSFAYIYAEEFFPYGDIAKNKYYDTLGYSIGELLESKNCPNCIEYDIKNVFGTNTNDVLSGTHIDDITQPDPVYGLIRNHNIYDEVALPPFSSVDFLYWSKNMESRVVNIDSIKMFLSRKHSYQGDLRNVLDIDGEYESLPFTYIVWEYPREGVVKTYDGLGLINQGSGVLMGMKLDSASVKSPLKFVKWEAQPVQEGVFLRVYVKNESDEELINTIYTHQEYEEKRDFEPEQEHIYEYIVNMDEKGSVGYAGIYNPNSKKECVARGEHLESLFVGDSPVVGGIREQDGGYLAYIGSRVKPYGYRFCVTRIPYTIYSGEIVLQVEEEKVEQEDVIVNEVTVEEQVLNNNVGEVLGIQELPKTSV